MQTFGQEPEKALKVFTCESGLRESVIGDKKLTYEQNGTIYGYSVGIAQIRYLPGRPDPELMKKAYYNIQYAKQLYDSRGWQPWTCAKKPGIVNPSGIDDF